jgi:hypothetical protein
MFQEDFNVRFDKLEQKINKRQKISEQSFLLTNEYATNNTNGKFKISVINDIQTLFVSWYKNKLFKFTPTNKNYK